MTGNFSEERYEEYLKYVLPVDTNLTKEWGDIQLNLTFTLLDIDDNGNVIQRVRKTTNHILKITQLPNWDSFVPDSALSALDQRILKQDAQIKALEELVSVIDNNKVDNLVYNGSHSINDTSYEEGYIYPHMEIIINQSGDLNIYNAIENRNTYIGNCIAGEVITLDYPIIQSSVSSHNIQNNFNWNFFRIANTFENSRNDLIISIPCTIKIEYSPIVKIGL